MPLRVARLRGIWKYWIRNKSEIAWNAADPEGDYVVGALAKRAVLVLSQTCDVENKDFIQVAPIYPSKEEGYIGKLARDEIISAFHLPKHPPDWNVEGYADFEQIQAIHKSYRTRPPRHFRLMPKKT
jgi:CO/xanthine dehydrogenase FAD-binding subunit